MRTKWLVGVVLAMFFASVTSPAVAAQGDRIVRTKALNGLPIVSGVCRLLGCTVLLSLDTPPASTEPSSLFLVRGLVDSVLTLVLSLLGLAAVEPDLPAGVKQDPTWSSSQSSAAVLDGLWNRVPVSYYGTTAWEGYLQQPANDIVRLRDTHCGLRQTGAGIVAVIATTTTVVIAANYMPVWTAKGLAILVSFAVNFSITHFVLFRPRREGV